MSVPTHQPESLDDFSVTPAGICRAAAAGDLDQLNRILAQSPTLIDADNPQPWPWQRGIEVRKPIELAAYAGHANVVARLLQLGANPIRGYHQNVMTSSALAVAKLNGHAKVIETIEQDILRRVDENPELLSLTDDKGNTLLHRAAYLSQASLIRALLQRGAHADQPNSVGTRPIHLVLYKGMGGPPRPAEWQNVPDLESAKLLIKHGAIFDLWCASAMGDVNQVEKLIGEDVAAANKLVRTGRFPATVGYPLSIGCREGHLNIVKLLLDAGANPDAPSNTDTAEPDESGLPMIFAVTHNHFDIAHLLLDRGARVDYSCIESAPGIVEYVLQSENQPLIDRVLVAGGKADIWFYVSSHNYAVISELLDRCADLPANRSGDDHSESVFDAIIHNASWVGEANVMRMCLRHRPKLDPRAGIRHVHAALVSHNRWGSYGDYKCLISQLLERGVDQNAASDGTPLHWLSTKYWTVAPEMEQMIDLAELFLQHGADINARHRENRRTPLACAAENGHRDYVEFLLSKGAAKSIPDDAPETTPLAIAKQLGLEDIAKLLA